MVQELLQNLLNRRDATDQTVKFPDVLWNIRTESTKFELVTCNTIQRLTLHRDVGVAKRKRLLCSFKENIGLY